MLWFLAGIGGVVMLALAVLLLWWLGRALDGDDHQDPPPPPPRAPAPPRRPQRGFEATERLELPPGPEGHQMFAVELERVVGAYRAHADDEMRRARGY